MARTALASSLAGATTARVTAPTSGDVSGVSSSLGPSTRPFGFVSCKAGCTESKGASRQDFVQRVLRNRDLATGATRDLVVTHAQTERLEDPPEDILGRLRKPASHYRKLVQKVDVPGVVLRSLRFQGSELLDLLEPLPLELGQPLPDPPEDHPSGIVVALERAGPAAPVGSGGPRSPGEAWPLGATERFFVP